MAVEKVTIQQAAGDLLKGTTPETTADTNSLNTTLNANLFVLGKTPQLQTPKLSEQYSATNTKNPIFGSQILEEPKVKEAASEIPQNINTSAFSKLSNFCKQITYKVNAYDSSLDPYVKYSLGHLPLESDIQSALGPRAIAIMRLGGIIES